MALIYIVIVALLIASSADGLQPGMALSPAMSAAATIAATLGYALAVAALGSRVLGRWGEGLGPDPELLRRYRRLVTTQRVLLLGVFAAQVYLLGWPQLVLDVWGLRGAVLVDELLIVAPFLAMLALSWAPMHRVENALRHSGWSLKSYMAFQLRHYVAVVLVPWAIFVAAFDVLTRCVGDKAWSSYAYWLAAGGMVGALYVLAPLGLRHLWQTARLPEGELRDRLLALCEQAKLRCRDILVWNTGGGRMANACISGAWARTRYIMLTDALLWFLGPREIESVFAHEVGHVKHRHMLYYLWFTATYVLFHSAVSEAAIAWFGRAPEAPLVFATAGVYWVFLFGCISRRLERQADVYATQLVGDVDAFVSSLEKINMVNGTRRRGGSWRHFSVANRVAFLRSIAADPAVEAQFERALRRWRAAVAAIAIACGAYLLLA